MSWNGLVNWIGEWRLLEIGVLNIRGFRRYWSRVLDTDEIADHVLGSVISDACRVGAWFLGLPRKYEINFLIICGVILWSVKSWSRSSVDYWPFSFPFNLWSYLSFSETPKRINPLIPIYDPNLLFRMGCSCKCPELKLSLSVFGKINIFSASKIFPISYHVQKELS